MPRSAFRTGADQLADEDRASLDGGQRARHLCRHLPCENFLYGFKAARRAARAAASAHSPSLPLRRRQRRSAGAMSEAGRAASGTASFGDAGGGVPAPAAGIVRGRSEPVKAICGRRATAPVKVPGKRTREDGLDWPAPASGFRVTLSV